MPQPMPEPIAPALAYALWQLDLVPTSDLPWVAAHWLVDGYDGPRIRELAGITRRETALIDVHLVLSALTEAGVVADEVPVHRTAAPLLARRLLAGELTGRDLCGLLWPGWDPDHRPGDEDEMEMLVYEWDDLLDHRERLARGRRPTPEADAEIDALDARSRKAAAALAENDVRGALAALREA